MDLLMCGGERLTLEDGTLATFADKDGQIIAVLTVSGDCWDKLSGARVEFNACAEGHIEYETTTTKVPATNDADQVLRAQALRVCRDLSGNPVKCPPR